ncbi:MAG TPA: trypsin-like peptidase domain-containing protein [Fimbriiglobus sp.]|nr:trypsin-like peptidase domain-containing protein [Fimbriiglobus sp.]
MAAIEARCPHCQARFLVPAEQAGKPAKCGRCRKPFTPTAAPPPAPASAPVRAAAAVAPAPKPVPARVARDEDDEDDRPRRRPRKPAKKPAGVHPGLLVGGGAAAVVLLAGFIALVVYLASPADPEPAPIKPPVGPALASARPSTPPVPEPTPMPVVSTTSAGGADAPADAIRRVKASTVYIRVHSDSGLSSGSGFFAGQEGYVVTNSHVVGFEPGQVELPRRVQVVVDSGEPTMRTFDQPKVRLVALDVENDLALLWVDGRGESRPLPKPLSFGRSAALVETQDVFIFGYPLGENLGLNISVNKSTVSSLRKDARGAIDVVQVAGGMHPGNSGGPVADKSGAVIGVSVAGILGTQINFAIPAEITAKFVREQIASGGNLKDGRFPTARPRRRR